jgi:hypothetical protein
MGRTLGFNKGRCMGEFILGLFQISFYLGIAGVTLIVGAQLFELMIKALATIAMGFIDILAKIFG